MKYIGTTIGLLAIGAAMGWAIGEVGSVQNGAYVDNNVYTEKLTFSEISTTIQRTRMAIPEKYGSLVSVSTSRAGTVLWFQDDKGNIRNAIVNEKDLIYIQRQGGSQ